MHVIVTIQGMGSLYEQNQKAKEQCRLVLLRDSLDGFYYFRGILENVRTAFKPELPMWEFMVIAKLERTEW